ncbi:glycosyltransferase, partial [Gemmatimonadota bacterium]
MRIAIVSPFITSYFDPTGLYYSSQQLHLAEALAARGNSVSVISGWRPGCMELSVHEDVGLTWLPLRRLGPGPVVMLKGLGDHIKAQGFDRVLAMESYSPVSLQAVRAHPNTFIYHGFTGTGGGVLSQVTMAALRRFVEPTVVKRSVGALAKSPEAAEYLRGLGMNSVSTVGVGVDTSHFVPIQEAERKKAREELGIPGGRVLLYVGNLLPRRDVATILGAFELAIQERGDLFLVLIGDGPDRRF